MKIIAFGHRKRVGKDTAVKLCLSWLNMNHPELHAYRCSFGDQLKHISYKMFSWGGLEDAVHYENHPELIEQILPPIGKSPRQIWNFIGTQIADFCDRVWIESAFATIPSNCEIVLIPDLRRPAEINFIRQYPESLLIRIDRENIGMSKFNPPDEYLTSFTDWDLILQNNGTIRDFNSQLQTLLTQRMGL